MNEQEQSFLEKLKATHTFPGKYSFKFIVASEKQDEVKKLLPKAITKFNESKGGKYTSITLTEQMDSAEKVLDIYKKAKQIEGIISL